MTGPAPGPAPSPARAQPVTATGPRIDPRFRQRRLQVRRQAGQRRLRFVVGFLAAGAVVLAAVGATRSALLDVDRVEIRGARRTPQPAVVEASGLGQDALMMDVDGAEVARRVQALPWVLRARARRVWPATVVIDVSERTPAAAVRAGGGAWAVVDGAGRVLEVVPARPGGAPHLTGVPAAGPPGSTLDPGAGEALRVAAALPHSLRSRVSEVALVHGGEVLLRLGPPGGEVRLGVPEPLEEKLTSATTVLEKANPVDLRVLDVRVPRAPVLTRR